jgi:peroxiredoxin
MRESARRVLLDLLAGLIAIFAVVGISIRSQFVGSDLRVLFAVTAAAFFLAGVARGRAGALNLWLKGLLVSCPGLLGTAALIMNDGLHRFPIPVAVSITAILFTVSGTQTRRWWSGTRGKSLLLSLVSVGVIALEAFVLVPRLVVFSSVHQADRLSPSFTLAALDGGTVRSSELRGHVVVLAFWATWCLPCRWELPEIETVYRRFQNDPRVAILAVDADWQGETVGKAKEFLARKKLQLPAAFDNNGAARALGIDSLPTVILIDQEGHVRMTHYGYDASEHMGSVISQQIEQLLGGASGESRSTP